MKFIFALFIFFTAEFSFAEITLKLSSKNCMQNAININYEIINNDFDIKIYKFALPWAKSEYGVNFKIFHKNTNGSFSRIRQDYFNQIEFDSISIKKNERIEKTVNISPYFGGIINAFENGDLYIYWEYDLISVDSSLKNKYSGFFIMHKNCKNN